MYRILTEDVNRETISAHQRKRVPGWDNPNYRTICRLDSLVRFAERTGKSNLELRKEKNDNIRSC